MNLRKVITCRRRLTIKPRSPCLSPDDSRRQGVVENLAASVYRQGENQLAAGNRDMAVSEYLRVASVAPTADLRRNAQFDAANLLIESKRWDGRLMCWSIFESVTRITPLPHPYPVNWRRLSGNRAKPNWPQMNLHSWSRRLRIRNSAGNGC